MGKDFGEAMHFYMHIIYIKYDVKFYMVLSLKWGQWNKLCPRKFSSVCVGKMSHCEMGSKFFDCWFVNFLIVMV